MGLATAPTGTGVLGGGTSTAAGKQIGVRGQTQSGVGVQGESFGEGVALQARSHGRDQGLAGQFIGNVHVQGNPGTSSGDLRLEGTSSFGGNVTCDSDVAVVGDVQVEGRILGSGGDLELRISQLEQQVRELLGRLDVTEPGSLDIPPH